MTFLNTKSNEMIAGFSLYKERESWCNLGPGELIFVASLLCQSPLFYAFVFFRETPLVFFFAVLMLFLYVFLSLTGWEVCVFFLSPPPLSLSTTPQIKSIVGQCDPTSSCMSRVPGEVVGIALGEACW